MRDRFPHTNHQTPSTRTLNECAHR